MADLSLTGHLEELRRRLLVCAGTWLAGFAVCYAFARPLFKMLATPLLAALPRHRELVFIHATEPFVTYLKVAALGGAIMALPVVLWQAWAFVVPALEGRERRHALPFVLASCCCFGLGVWFGFGYVFPQIFRFLIGYGTVTGEIQPMLSMASYLSLSCQLLTAFGLVFELPIVVYFLARMGIIDHRWLAARRRYALLAAFIIGGVLSPPDIVSQTALAIPFMVLYEIGILVARFLVRPQGKTSQK